MTEYRLIPQPEKDKQAEPFNTPPKKDSSRHGAEDLREKHSPTQVEQQLAHISATAVVTTFKILKTTLTSAFQILTWFTPQS